MLYEIDDEHSNIQLIPSDIINKLSDEEITKLGNIFKELYITIPEDELNILKSKNWFNNDWIHTTIIDNKKVNIIKVKYIYNL